MAKVEKIARPKKAKAKKPPTKAELLQEADELLTRIEAKVEEQKQARYRVDSAREAYKTAKGDLMARTSELERLANARKEKHPLFELPKEPDQKKEAEQPLLTDAGTEADSLQAASNNCENDDWKAESIDRLKSSLTTKQCIALEESGLKTLGELQEKMNRHGAFWAGEVKIAGRFRQPIEDAFNDFLMKRAA